MTRDPKPFQTNQPIRFQKEQWDELQAAAKTLGITRSALIRAASLHAAQSIKDGRIPYFVDDAKASLQNMGIKFFSCAADQKSDTGGGRNASTDRGAIAKQRSIGSAKRNV